MQGEIERAMRLLEVSWATLFRFVKQFREDAQTSALLLNTPVPKLGMLPFDPDVETIVSGHFKDFHPTRRKATKTRFWREVAADCRAQGCATVHPPPRLMAGVEGPRAAHGQAGGQGQGRAPPLSHAWGLPTNRALDIVQIDHTKADVTVVDPVTRGIPKAIYVDNSAEFHARTSALACSEYQIDLRHRPPGTPRYGGQIERLIGTMMGRCICCRARILPTFSSAAILMSKPTR